MLLIISYSVCYKWVFETVLVRARTVGYLLLDRNRPVNPSSRCARNRQWRMCDCETIDICETNCLTVYYTDYLHLSFRLSAYRVRLLIRLACLSNAVSSVSVCRSSRPSRATTDEPIYRDAIWGVPSVDPGENKELCIRWPSTQIPHGKGQLWGFSAKSAIPDCVVCSSCRARTRRESTSRRRRRGRGRSTTSGKWSGSTTAAPSSCSPISWRPARCDRACVRAPFTHSDTHAHVDC